MAKTYSLVISGSSGIQFVQNVLHFQCSETGSHDAYEWAADLIAAWKASVESSWMDLLPGDYTLLSYKARRVSAPGGPTGVNLVASSGGHVGNVESAGMSVEMRFPVVISGKNVTGKIFIPGIPNGLWSDNVLAPAYATLCATFMTNLLTPLSGPGTGSTYDFGVWRSPKTTPHVVVEAFTIATHGNVSPKPVNLRRRNVPV